MSQKNRLNKAQERQKKDVEKSCLVRGGSAKKCRALGFAVAQSKPRGTKKKK